MSEDNVLTKKRLLEDSFDITPAGLQFCFDRELFLRDEFNVDKFVMRQKKVVSLEILREDLMQYFNILKNSLVELINQDYADFVNLSTNLVGLDKVINTIEVPVEKERLNIEKVRNNIDNLLDEINKRNHGLRMLNDKRELIKCIENVQRYVLLLEKHLKINTKANESINTSDDDLIRLSEFDNLLDQHLGQKLEVAGYELIRLEYFASKCSSHPIVGSFKKRIGTITSELLSQCENFFIKSLKEGNKKGVKQALRTYLTLNRVNIIEDLYRDRFVQPELEKLSITKKNLEQDINLLYKTIMEIVDKLLENLNNLLIDDEIDKYELINDFDFLVNSIFPEVVYFIIRTMPQLFSPGNPDLFHQRYTSTLRFIESIEDRCSNINQLNSLRDSKAFKDFNNKWSVPIYFQIRYQEIASTVDRELCKEELTLTKSQNFYTFPMIDIIHKSIIHCWKEGVYLDALRHRFWKLTLQLLNVLENYASNIDWTKFSNDEDTKQDDETSRSFKLINIKTLFIIDLYRFLNVDDLEGRSSNNYKLSWIYQKYLLPTLNDCHQLSEKDNILLQEVLEDSANKLTAIISKVIAGIQSNLVEQCVQSVKAAVFDIPRQYRRTNRPWPTVASNYVGNIFKPIVQFLTDNKEIEEFGNLKVEILRKIIIDITVSYQEQIKDLLNSIKKMEDSLKMLKRTRGGGASNENSTNDKNAVSVSDDNKIRQQVKIDVSEFQMKGCDVLGCIEGSVPELIDLVNLVDTMCSVADN